jgi:hypothetical protein
VCAFKPFRYNYTIANALDRFGRIVVVRFDVLSRQIGKETFGAEIFALYN